jgi:TRAP-type C4-dicarboxylate transport system substrate-binding protein
MDTGVVDGFRLPLSTSVPLGLHEITKYYLEHTFYKANMTFIMNPDSWNRIPKHLQDLLQEAIIELENETPAAFRPITDKAMQTALDAGMEIIRFSPEDAEWFQNLAYESEWDALFEKYPDRAAKLKELLTK